MLDDDSNDTTPTERTGSNDEHVRSLGEDRYVVSLEDQEDPAPITGDEQAPPPGSDTGRRLDDLDGAYAFELHARHENGADSLRVETNDVGEAFESLLRWYAGKVAPDTPPEAVVGTLLANSNLDPGGRR
jgi:hypothetical protein